jgi:hypothetical protein
VIVGLRATHGYIRKVQPEQYCLAHGYAKTREGAMAAFAKSWRRE